MKKSENRLKIATKEEFEYWLFYLDDVLEDFLDFLPHEISKKLDFSSNSLDILEEWILDRYPSIEVVLQFDQSSVLDALAIYVGETFRKMLGGKWSIELEDLDFVFCQEPILTVFDEHSSRESPLSLVTASIDRRTGTYLRKVLENKAKRMVSSRS
jgi:hypothetical protein